MEKLIKFNFLHESYFMDIDMKKIKYTASSQPTNLNLLKSPRVKRRTYHRVKIKTKQAFATSTQQLWKTIPRLEFYICSSPGAQVLAEMTAASQKEIFASWREEHSTGKRLNLSQLHKCTLRCQTDDKKENILCILTGSVQFSGKFSFLCIHQINRLKRLLQVNSWFCCEQVDEVTITLLETEAEP